MDVSEVGGTNNYIAKISEADGKISATTGTIDTTVTASSSNLITSGAVSTAITNVINALDVTDTAVSGQYVSAVSETNGVITVTRANLPDVGVTGVKGNSESNYRTGNVNLTAANIGAVDATREGQANGIATLDANGKLPASQATQANWNQTNSSAIDYIKNKPTIPSGVTYGGNPVSSIVQGTNTTMSLNSSGALTISATGGGTIPVATSSTVGGVKVSSGGSKTFDYTWSGTDDAPTTTSGTRSVTVYKPSGTGHYYPVECTNDGTAVFCVPIISSPWWNMTTSPNDISVEIDRGSSGTYCNSITITCPVDALYAELTYTPMDPALYGGTPVTISKIQTDQQRNGPGSTRISFTLDSSSQAVPRAPSSVTYKFMTLKFTTTVHTYLASIKFASRSTAVAYSLIS